MPPKSKSILAGISWALNEIFEVSPVSTQTWICLGAVLQVLSIYFLSSTWSTLLPFLYLGFVVVKTWRNSKGALKTSYTNVKMGRWTGELRSRGDGEENKGLVCFVLGARVNHPMGPLAPGVDEIGKAFENMWVEARNNSEKWGYLGHTATLHDVSDAEGLTTIWLSYWSSLASLQAFSASSAHRVGEIAYAKGKYPYMGIMHETFYAPQGKWETIYGNMPPWGLGKVLEREMRKVDEGKEGGAGVSRGIKGAWFGQKREAEHGSMFERMKRNV